MTKKLVYILLFALCFWFGGFLGFSYVINNFQINSEVKTDAIVALTGGRNRIGEAVNLLNEGRAEKLFISGVFEGTSLEELKKRDDIDVNTSREITLDKKARNTVENAIEALRWVEENDIESIRLVTSNYHLPRSMEEFRADDHRLKIIAHPVFSDKVEKKWWKSWKSFSLIAMEYNKFLYVWTRNHLGLKKGN